jgi:hypothetical protein
MSLWHTFMTYTRPLCHITMTYVYDVCSWHMLMTYPHLLVNGYSPWRIPMTYATMTYVHDTYKTSMTHHHDICRFQHDIWMYWWYVMVKSGFCDLHDISPWPMSQHHNGSICATHGFKPCVTHTLIWNHVLHTVLLHTRFQLPAVQAIDCTVCNTRFHGFCTHGFKPCVTHQKLLWRIPCVTHVLQPCVTQKTAFCVTHGVKTMWNTRFQTMCHTSDLACVSHGFKPCETHGF